MGRLRGFRKQSGAALFLCALRNLWSTALEKTPGQYDVGYAKPPDATKFGNRPQPTRRRRKRHELPNILSLLTESVEISRDGKAQKLHSHEVMMLSLFKRAVKRELRAIKRFLKECKKAGLLEPPPTERTSGVLVCPKWMPIEMFMYVGEPPWNAKHYDQAAAKFKSTLRLFDEWYPGARERAEHEHKI
jgi:hypothetical protein